jgi:hypothetical protein
MAGRTSWSVQFSASADLTWARYYIVPMTCTKHTASSGLTVVNIPGYCVDALCTIVRWTDATIGAWGPGLSWPANYKQNSSNHIWIGGPALCIGGQCYRNGKGLNGDNTEETIFDGRLTAANNGYARLEDDSQLVSNNSNTWLIDFNPQDDLTSAEYYTCSNTCEETVFMINRQYLPLTVK